MNTYGVPEVFCEQEIEERKEKEDYSMEGLKVLGLNLIDEHQAYLFIQDEDGEHYSIIVNFYAFVTAVREMITERNNL